MSKSPSRRSTENSSGAWRKSPAGRHSYLYPAPGPDAKLTLEEASEALVRWVDALDMRHWRFALVLHDGPENQNLGQVHCSAQSLFATISLLNPNAPDHHTGNAALWPISSEETLVHEIVHTMLQPLMEATSDEERDRANEALTNQLSRCLLRLAREGLPEPAPKPEERMLKWFAYKHLPAHLQDISVPFGALAESIVDAVAPGPERTVALRKLREAKDACVRASGA